MLTIKYYILRVMLTKTWNTFCTTFSLFEQRFVPIKCQTSGKKEQNQRIWIMVNLVCLKFARLFCPVYVIFWPCGVSIVAESFILHPCFFFYFIFLSGCFLGFFSLLHVLPHSTVVHVLSHDSTVTTEQGRVPPAFKLFVFKSTWKQTMFF